MPIVRLVWVSRFSKPFRSSRAAIWNETYSTASSSTKAGIA
jgi:hypothetical protein